MKEGLLIEVLLMLITKLAIQKLITTSAHLARLSGYRAPQNEECVQHQIQIYLEEY